MHRRFIKLVRDRIPQFVGDSTIVYEPVGDRAKIVDALRKKLVEEAIEFLVNPSTEELGDVKDVVEALERYDPAVSADMVERYRSNKEDERGVFDDGLGMYIYTTAGAAHEGEHVND